MVTGSPPCDSAQRMIILVVDDVEETRDTIEALFAADGYVVLPARSEDDAVDKLQRHSPNLILLSLGTDTEERIATGIRIRSRAHLSELIPIVIFCCPRLAQGAEVEIDNHVYLTRPDNFNQLRRMLRRLLAARQ